MVRMREVLKSVRDLTRTSQSRPYSEGGEQADSSGLSFPQPGGKTEQEQNAVSGAQPAWARSQGNLQNVSAIGVHNETSASATDAAQEISRNDLYHDAIADIHEMLTRAASDEPYDLVEIENKAKLFSESLFKSDQLFLQGLSTRSSLTSLAQHSANVSIISIKVGIGLKLPTEKIVDVGMCGMVHEIGMMKIPPDLLNKKGELSPSEFEMIKQHPIYGRNYLEPFRDEYPFLPDVVSQEHERWNGKGYPFGLKENEIHEYAQILGLADTFVALTHLRHYRDNFIAYKAMQSIIERRNVDFSARIIKALIEVISIFPVHSLVKLNDGRVAKVLETNKQYPVRPVIEIIRDAKGQPFAKSERIDLSREPMIYIVSPILDESAYQ